MQVLTNHVGFAPSSAKRATVQHDAPLQAQAFSVVVLQGTAVATPAAANPYVSPATSSAVTTAGTEGTSTTAPQIVVGTPIVGASGQLLFTAGAPVPADRTAAQAAAADQAEGSVLTVEWLQELEAAAAANWSKLMGQ